MPSADVIMPKMGDGMETGTLLSWKKRDGESVKAGDAIAEIQTDKSIVEIEAEESGVLRTSIAEGQSVPVGVVIATIGDGAAPIAKAAEPPKPAQAAAVPVAEPQAQPKAAAARNGDSGGRIKASPLARRIARERGVSLEGLTGTGPHGRIVEADVVAASVSRPAATAVAPAPRAAVALGKPYAMSPMRSIIARRMSESKGRIPHFYVTSEIDMESAVEFRRQLNGIDESKPKVSINDMIVKACALALMKVPEVNRSFQGASFYQPDAAHVGIAVALEDGLIVPVVKNANSKPLRALARESRELIEKARGQRLQPSDYSGGTFTVSNMGPFDVESFAAIIDPSQGAILAVGSMRKVPAVMPDDAIAVRQRMNVTLSGDHRVMDGAAGAKFLQEVKKLLQNPISLLDL